MDDDNDDLWEGKHIQKWSDLDPFLPILDLDIELFKRQNVSIASRVIISGLLKSTREQRDIYIAILNPLYFDQKSLLLFLFNKIINYLRENEIIPIEEMEKWIPEYSTQVWGEVSRGRVLIGEYFTLRQILTFEPTDAQVMRAIELRRLVMERKKNQS